MEKKFIDGLRFEAPHEKAPDWVKAKGSIKREDLIDWLSSQTDEWINFNVKLSQKGNWYAEVDTWKPEGKVPLQSPENISVRSPEQVSKIINQGMDDDLPF